MPWGPQRPSQEVDWFAELQRTLLAHSAVRVGRSMYATWYAT